LREAVLIGFLRGALVAKTAPILVLDVNGVGYEVEVPLTTFYSLPEVGEQLHLHTHFVVREDAQLLFGFSTLADRSLFRSLIKINGVGAKLALNLLSGLSVEAFYRCVQDHDTAALVKLPGIGKKTAERLIIEIRDRLPQSVALDTDSSADLGSSGTIRSSQHEAVSALLSLGYKEQDARRMVAAVDHQGKSIEELIRLALQSAS